MYISCPVVLVGFPQNASKIIDVAFGCFWMLLVGCQKVILLSPFVVLWKCWTLWVARGSNGKKGYKTCLVLYRHSHSDRLAILYYTYSMTMFTDIFQYIALVSPKTLYVCVAHLRFGSSNFCPKLYWGELAIPSFVAPLGIRSWRASRLALVLWVQRVGIPLFFDFSGVDALDDRDP